MVSIVGGVGILLAGAAPVRAQLPTDTIQRDTVYKVEAVVVRGQREVTTAGGASVVAVVPDSLPIGPVPTLERALRELPFVLVRQNSRGMTEISVRGSDSRQVAVLLDGVPLTLAWDHRTDPSVIPLMGAARLTVARGLPSVLSGPNVLGGVIEVDLGRAGGAAMLRDDVQLTAGVDHTGSRALGATGRAVLLEGGEGRLVVRAGAGLRSRDGVPVPEGVEGTGGTGTGGTGTGGTGTGGTSLPGQTAAAAAAVADADGLRLNSDVESANGFAAVRWEGERGRWVSLSTSGFRAERGVPPELHVSEPRLWRYPDEWQVVSALTAGTGQRSTPWGTGDLEVSLGVRTGEQRIEAFDSVDYRDVVGTESGEGSTLTLRLLGDHTLGRSGELRSAVTYTDVRHTEILDGSDRSDFRQRLWSFGGELAWRLPAATRLSVGAALDGADTPETGGRPGQPRMRAWGGRMGVTTLALGSDVRVHGSVSTRARFPSLRELYSGALGRFEPNPGLEPERLLAAEAGATLKRDRLEVQATVFRHHLSDAVVRTTTAEGNYRRVNRDAIRSFGLELLAAHALGPVQVMADLMLQDVSVESDAGSGPLRPEHMPEFRIGLDVDAPLPMELRGLASVDHTGSQYCVHPDLGRDVELDGTTRVDLAVRRSFDLGSGFWNLLGATLGLENATDAAAYDQCGMPQPGRTLRLGIEIS